jgi:hypothetical protein
MHPQITCWLIFFRNKLLKIILTPTKAGKFVSLNECVKGFAFTKFLQSKFKFMVEIGSTVTVNGPYNIPLLSIIYIYLCCQSFNWFTRNEYLGF